MILLTVRDLRHRLVRFIAVVAIGGVVFALLFVMTGLVEQFNREPIDTIEGIGGSVWVVAESTSSPFTGASAMPTQALAAIDGDGVAPIVIGRNTLRAPGDEEPTNIVVFGATPGRAGFPDVAEGSAIDGEGELVVDRTAGVDIGDEVVVGDVPFTVVGLTERTTVLAGLPLAFTSVPQAQALVFGSDAVVTAAVASSVASVPEGFEARTPGEIEAATAESLESAISSIDLVRALLWVVAGVIIGAVVFLSALERQRDFAVLKAVGTSTRVLVGSMAIQTVLIALGAVAVGALLQIVLVPVFPLTVLVPTRAFWQLPVFAVVLALIAGVAGLRRVAAADPVAAFAGAGQ